MASNAIEAQGMAFKYGDGASTETFTAICGITSISGPSGSSSIIDVTDLCSTAKEKRLGLKDEGEITLSINYNPSDAGHTILRTDFSSGDVRNYQIVFTDTTPTTWDFAAYVNGFSISGAVDDVVKAEITLVISGAIVES